MNRLSALTLKVLRKTYQSLYGKENYSKPDCVQDPDTVAKLIYNKLNADAPCMIARFGANELACLINYFAIQNSNKNIISFVKGESAAWWWENWIIKQMHEVAGFFPPTANKLEEFCDLMLQDIHLIDILGSWLTNECYFDEELKDAVRVKRIYMEPFWSNLPWTSALEGKRVLVIHPFTETIQKQYEKRKLLFKNEILPQFELKTIKAVQSAAGLNQTEFADWFQALNYMKENMNKIDFDICLIGAGAYGLPLAAHAKRIGKKGVHIGGALQLFFGIRGKRWDNPHYNKDHNYLELVNEHWVRPLEKEKPEGARKIENATYW